MRGKEKPPDVKLMLPQYLAGGRHRQLVALAGGPAPDGKYLHWDQLRHRDPPDGLTREEWWLGIKVARAPGYRYVPLRSRDGNEFILSSLWFVDSAVERIDAEARGVDAIARRGLTEDQRLDALMDEAVHSAQMDGAVMPREAAKAMLRSGRAPVTRHEQLVCDTWEGLLHVVEVAGEPMTPELFTEIHRAMTARTLGGGEAGRLRQPHEDPAVHTLRGEPLFDPPLADELPDRMPAFCAFANGETPDQGLHPVLRAILLHLWVGYDHPFVEGNGRIARAMTLWSMLSQGYPLFQYLPTSRVHRRERSAYERAFSWVTSDGFDATYFALYVLEAVGETLEALESGTLPEPPSDPGGTPPPVPSRSQKHPQATMLEHAMSVGGALNERQLALVKRALRDPDEVVTVKSHQARHDIAAGTARADLNDLYALGFVVRRRVGRAWEYRTVRAAVDRLFE